MKQRPYATAIILGLIAVGFVMISFVQGKSDVTAKQANAMSTALPTANLGRPLGCINAYRHEYSRRVPSPDTRSFLERVWK